MPRFTRAAEDIFVANIELTGNATKAALEAGISRYTLYDRMAGDTDFRERMYLAKDEYRDRLLREARRRAVEGVPIPRTDNGRIAYDWNGKPIEKRRYSDAPLIYLIEAEDGCMEYRENELMGGAPSVPALPAPQPKALPPPVRLLTDQSEGEGKL